jgi:hypothetical protein
VHLIYKRDRRLALSTKGEGFIVIVLIIPEDEADGDCRWGAGIIDVMTMKKGHER